MALDNELIKDLTCLHQDAREHIHVSVGVINRITKLLPQVVDKARLV